MKLNCVICDKEMEGRADKLYCSRNCQAKGQRNNEKDKPKICAICGKEFLIKSKYANGRLYCYECIPEGSKNSRGEILKAIKTHLGGKCEICGYDRYLGALEFHHKDPSEKDFTISNGDFKLIDAMNEIEKCVMICSNCHRELHGGIIKLKGDR